MAISIQSNVGKKIIELFPNMLLLCRSDRGAEAEGGREQDGVRVPAAAEGQPEPGADQGDQQEGPGREGLPGQEH